MPKQITNLKHTFVAEVTGGAYRGVGAAKANITVTVDGVEIRPALEDDKTADGQLTTIREAIEHILPGVVKIRTLRRM